MLCHFATRLRRHVAFLLFEVPGDKKSLGIQRGHRLGAPRHGSAKARAIIVCFGDFQTKELVRSKRHSLRAPFGVSEDLPLAIRKARQSLVPKLKELKKTRENN